MMSNANIPEQHVPVCRLVDGANGESRFEDAAIGYTTNLGPLRQTTVIPATAISFHWRPAGFLTEIHPTVRRRVILITEGAAEVTIGSGETRIFRRGDVLESLDCEGSGHVIRALDDRPFRAAIIELDDSAGRQITESPWKISEKSLPFLRNVTGEDGQSHFEDGTLAYVESESGILFTEEIALTAFQFVLALGDLSYDFHNAPQRQIVLPLTDGIEGENGDGSRKQAPPGGVYFGEDTTGQGHITRALDGTVRFSIFAFLV